MEEMENIEENESQIIAETASLDEKSSEEFIKKNSTEYKISDEELAGKYAKYCDENLAFKLLKKIRYETRNSKNIVLKKTGEKFVTVLGHLLSALKNKDVPAVKRGILMGAIGYCVLPFDIVADYIQILGWLDDIAIAASVVVMIQKYSDFDLKTFDKAITDSYEPEEDENWSRVDNQDQLDKAAKNKKLIVIVANFSDPEEPKGFKSANEKKQYTIFVRKGKEYIYDKELKEKIVEEIEKENN